MVKKYNPGEFFGELALLYNAPRAASIYAKADDCVVWALDRETFNNIVKDASVKKREKYVNFLSNVEILKTLNDYEINLIADAIKEEKIARDEYIIKQGETGDKFYILEEGKAVAIKTFDENNITEEVYSYTEGTYFGELALIKDEPRAASVKAVSDCKFLSLDRMSFKRLLGPLLNLLKKNSELYQKFSKQL
jgi:cAMP-dependent protein kinase regulator